MNAYQKWLDSIGLTEELASELTTEEIFNRINSIPVVIELDSMLRVKNVWTIKQAFSKPVQVYINRQDEAPNYLSSQEIQYLI